MNMTIAYSSSPVVTESFDDKQVAFTVKVEETHYKYCNKRGATRNNQPPPAFEAK